MKKALVSATAGLLLSAAPLPANADNASWCFPTEHSSSNFENNRQPPTILAELLGDRTLRPNDSIILRVTDSFDSDLGAFAGGRVDERLAYRLQASGGSFSAVDAGEMSCAQARWTAPIVLEPTEFTLVAYGSDLRGREGLDVETVLVLPEEQPVGAPTISPDCLWPPNNKFVCYELGVDVHWPNLNIGNFIVSDGNNGRDVSPDDVIVSERGFCLRSERAGGGQGRTYTLTLVDDAGEHTADVHVLVPHNGCGESLPSASFLSNDEAQAFLGDAASDVMPDFSSDGDGSPGCSVQNAHKPRPLNLWALALLALVLGIRVRKHLHQHYKAR